MRSTCKILAHRGASADRPENTLEAFRLAMRHCADGFELDVHLTQDGHVVVAHDEALERVSNGNGLIADHKLEDLKKLTFSKQYPSQPSCEIPTLAEVYALVADTKYTINVELKNTMLPYLELPQKLIDLELEYAMTGRVIYSSFNHYPLRTIQQLAAKAEREAQIGLLYESNLLDPWLYAKNVGASAIHPHYKILKAYPEIVESCREHGIKVNTWTVDELADMEFLFKLNVDAIITGKPNVAYFLRDDE